MTKALNIAYFDQTDELPGKSIAKLNKNLRRICAFLLEIQNAPSVSTKISISNDKILNQTQQMVSETSKDFNSRLDTVRSEMTLNYDSVSKRLSNVEEDMSDLFDDIYPVGIVVCNRSKTDAPIKKKTWKFLKEDTTNGVCFWERTA